MTLSQALATPVDQTIESMELAPSNGFHLEPRCRVCRNDQVRKKVNDLLATGASYAMVLRALGEDNNKLDKCNQVTIDSVRNHCGRHFPVQQTTHATYREILERRARENQVDFVEGVATALTPLAFYEVAMNKAFRALVDDRTEVSVETGLRAAEKLQSVLDGRERGTDVLELKVQLGRIGEAVRAVVPQQMWAAIVERLEELEQHSGALGAVEDSFDNADDDPYDPTEFMTTTTTTSSDIRSARRHRGRWDGCRCSRNCSAASVVKPDTVWHIASRWQRETNATSLRALR